MVLDTDSRPYMPNMLRMDTRLSVAKNMNAITAMMFGPNTKPCFSSNSKILIDYGPLAHINFKSLRICPRY